jgi:hypothetical protein
MTPKTLLLSLGMLLTALSVEMLLYGIRTVVQRYVK